jgi:general secretion pathway protein E
MKLHHISELESAAFMKTEAISNAAIEAITLEQLVTDRQLIPAETLSRARLVQIETGERFDSVLTRLGLVSEQILAQTIAGFAGLSVVPASDFPLIPLELNGVSMRFLRESKALPLKRQASHIDVAFADPLDPYPQAALAFAFGVPVKPCVARASDIEAAIDRLYGAATVAGTSPDSGIDELDLERMKDLTSDAPVIRAVNRLITLAVERRASDIHVEPTEDALGVRLRVDGALQETESLPAVMKLPFVARIKVMAGLNIAEKRLPQDGRLRLAVRGHDIDLRVATSPTIYGEAVVLRILDRSELSLDFEALGFDAPTLERFQAVLNRPHGIVLVTGPTGSGKTTTLYAALASLNTADRKILTIEDPIEYRLAGINQTQVSAQIGLNFSTALRSFLRQDPDIMMVGEIRDLETATVAVQAALTGHGILSTLHTNTAASAIMRLLDMGVEPFLITSTLNAVLAQRLVRRLCTACREPQELSCDAVTALGIGDAYKAPISTFRAMGCTACGQTGYRGRLALLELLVMDESITRLILTHSEARDLHKAAIVSGMRSMLDDGLLKARNGLTTIDEVLRVTREV